MPHPFNLGARSPDIPKDFLNGRALVADSIIRGDDDALNMSVWPVEDMF